MQRIAGGFLGGALYTHTSAHDRPENVLLDTWDGGVCNVQCKKLLGGTRVALRTHIPLHTIGQKRWFWMLGMGVFGMHNAENIV